ncbi:MAG: hypothetical protein AAYR33_10080 [Acetobacteraceae bacterium]
MTSIADILRGALLLVTLLGVVRTSHMPTLARRGPIIVSTLQLLLTLIYVLVTEAEPQTRTTIMPASWVLLWILSTLEERAIAGRLGQFAGLAMLFSRHPVEMVFFAGGTYLLTAPTEKLRRFSPRTFCVIGALLIASHPLTTALPTAFCVSAALAALVGFATAPVIGFALCVHLLPAALSAPWVSLLFIAAAIFLVTERQSNGIRTWPLLVLGLTLMARHDHLDGVAINATRAFLMAMIILPATSTRRTLSSSFLTLPLPPLPMFIAASYGVLAFSLYAMSMPKAALLLVLPILIFGHTLAHLFILPLTTPPTPTGSGEENFFPRAISLTAILIPGACLGLVGNALSVPASPLGDHTFVARLFGFEFSGTFIWWTPIILSFLFVILLLRQIVRHVQLSSEDRILVENERFTGDFRHHFRTNRNLLRSILEYRKFFRSIAIDSAYFINKRVAQGDYLVKIIFFLVLLALMVVGFRGAFSWP